MTINGIKTNVQALLVNSGYFGATNIKAAPIEGDTVDFAGYPAVSHYYVGTSNDYATVSQNRRVVEYEVSIYLVTDATTTIETEFQEAYDLIDSIIQLFDVSRDLSSPGHARACDIMRPAPGDLMRVTTNEGVGLGMTIRLFCESDVAFI